MVLPEGVRAASRSAGWLGAEGECSGAAAAASEGELCGLGAAGTAAVAVGARGRSRSSDGGDVGPPGTATRCNQGGMKGVPMCTK